MGGLSVRDFCGFSGALVAVFALSSQAAADKIGGSNLPSQSPTLKGRIAEDGSASSVFVMTGGVGTTSNAGPTLAEIPSVFIDRGLGYATFWSTPLGRVDATVNLSDRLYTDFEEADERAAVINVTLAKDWAGQQTLVAFAFSDSLDVEERLSDTSLSITHTWTGGTAVKPYVKAETVLLDYHDVPSLLLPFRNQDDRDRISSRAQLGLRLTLTGNLELEVGAGIDVKHYLECYDDFGVRRDSVSPFPFVGLSYAGGMGSLRALYMPFWRDYRESLFPDAWTHGYAVEGETNLSDTLKAFAAARYGFEETDFLIASAAHESVALVGLVLTVGRGNISLAASETRRTYEDLDLVGLARADRKFEIALAGEMPLIDTISLNGRISYLDYESSFGDVGTNAVTASMGLTYAAAH